MTIAFLIIAHADATHLKRLCARLSGHDIFVHWDSKAGAPPDIPGVTFARERASVFWAGFSQVVATINVIRTALATGKAYDKFMLLSGSCYPIRPISELEEMFRSDGDHNYINAVSVCASEHLTSLISQRLWRDQALPLWVPRNQTTLKVERLFRALANLALQRFAKKPLEGISLFHGSTWWAISRAAAAHVVNVFDAEHRMRTFYKFTFASDEQFFHTVLRNSEFEGHCDPPIPYSGRGTWKTANLHIIDSSLTKWFSLEDVAVIEQSDRYFVRKVKTGTSGSLLDWIDKARLSR